MLLRSFIEVAVKLFFYVLTCDETRVDSTKLVKIFFYVLTRDVKIFMYVPTRDKTRVVLDAFANQFLLRSLAYYQRVDYRKNVLEPFLLHSFAPRSSAL